jgi:hypothetical protein
MLKKSPIRSCEVNLDEDDKLIIYMSGRLDMRVLWLVMEPCNKIKW